MKEAIEKALALWCDAYYVRHLVGQNGIKEAAAAIAALYEARLAEIEQALRHLRNEAHGVVHTWRYELAELAGETNVACLLRRIQEADKALAAGEGGRVLWAGQANFEIYYGAPLLILPDEIGEIPEHQPLYVTVTAIEEPQDAEVEEAAEEDV